MAIPGLIVASVIVSMAIQPSLGVPLSYEAQDTVLDLMSEKGFTGLATAKLWSAPRPIFRKDLGSSIAYYEIVSRDGKEYFLLSAGPKTGDYRFVESGEINATAGKHRPTDALNLQAKSNGQYCAKYYRLSQAGLNMCEDYRGDPVAATLNWTSNAPIDIKQLSSLPEMVKMSLADFKKEWQEVASEMGQPENEWRNLRDVKSSLKNEPYGEEALAPGSRHRVSLGFKMKSAPRILFTGTGGKKSNLTNADWQTRLCQVLGNVCASRDNTQVNSSLFVVAPNGINYFELSVHQDKATIQKLLLNTDISFSVQVTLSNRVIEKRFGIETVYIHCIICSWNEWSIHYPYLFPDYEQHRCCGCYSGCGPVAWAQIFAYYDRLAHISPWYGYCTNIYQGIDGVSGNGAVVSPRWFTPRRYVENIRAQVNTFCWFGGGATTYWDMTDSNLLNWFQYRQSPLSGSLSAYTNWWSSLPGIYRPWIRDSAINAIRDRYPVIVGIWVGLCQHYAVATRYRLRCRRWRICFWFCGWRCTPWFYIWTHEWYLHMGWGGYGNCWRNAKAFSAFVARN